MRVVVVDPSRTVQKLVSRVLEARDHEVHPFGDGAEALECVKTNPAIDALLTSTVLPSMSGLELCWEARLLIDASRPFYILMMSSNNDRQIHIEALDGGADDFICKPLIPEELYARLRAAERLAAMQRELIKLANTDALTGLLNRRAFFIRAADTCAAARAPADVSTIMMDIDHFKQVNDVYGHDIGDEVLRAVAATAGSEPAIVGRLGGEEFALVLQGQSIESAMGTADRLRSEVESLEFKGPDGTFNVTSSFGVTGWRPEDTIDRMLKRADIALYAAKFAGRNRVMEASDDVLASYANGGSGVVRVHRR
jgi:two-component system, cell cycle response regulator